MMTKKNVDRFFAKTKAGAEAEECTLEHDHERDHAHPEEGATGSEGGDGGQSNCSLDHDHTGHDHNRHGSQVRPRSAG